MRVLLLLVVTFFGVSIVSAFAGLCIFIALNKEGPPPAREQSSTQSTNLEIAEWQREMRRTQQKNNAAIRAARRWSDSKLARHVRDYVLEGTSWDDDEEIYPVQVLLALGPRVHEPVLALVNDRSLYPQLVRERRYESWSDFPFERACQLLGETPPPSAVEGLIPFQSDPEPKIRNIAANTMAKIGTGSIVPYLRIALVDSDEQVARSAVNGLRVALERKNLAPHVQKMIVPDLKQLLRQGKWLGNVASLLTLLDPADSPQFFLSSEVLRADSPAIGEVLIEILGQKITVPPDQLQALIAGLETKTMEYPTDYALGNALRLVGRQQLPEAESFLRQRISHENVGVAYGAADGLLNLAGLEDFESKIWVYEDEASEPVLNQQQKLYQLVWDTDSAISDSGIFWYFQSSSGDRWREALASFETLGLKEHHAILSEAVALFGSDGPAADLETRTRQMKARFSEEGTEFEALDARYFETEESLKIHTTNYVLENVDAFR